MLTIAGILVALIVLWFLLYFKKALLKTKYRLKFEALQEELAACVAQEGIDPNSWAVSFLSKSISKASSRMNDLNFHAAWGLHVLYSKDKELNSFISKLQAELNQSANAPLRSIYYKFGNIIIDYVVKKHKIFRQIFLKIHHVKEHRNNRDRRKPTSQILEKIRSFRVYPQTSASREFFR